MGFYSIVYSCFYARALQRILYREMKADFYWFTCCNPADFGSVTVSLALWLMAEEVELERRFSKEDSESSRPNNEFPENGTLNFGSLISRPIRADVEANNFFGNPGFETHLSLEATRFGFPKRRIRKSNLFRIANFQPFSLSFHERRKYQKGYQTVLTFLIQIWRDQPWI